MIPVKQLCNPDFRFAPLPKMKKEPPPKGWRINNYYWNDPIIAQAENYAVLGGYGGLIIMDVDCQQGANLIRALPETFTVLTSEKEPGFRGQHAYFICTEIPHGLELADYDKHLGELRNMGQYVVGPGSTHPSGLVYEVLQDLPIAVISKADLMAVIGPFIKADLEKERESRTASLKEETDETCAAIKKKLKLSDLMESYGMDTLRNPGKCPWHFCSNNCFSWDDVNGIWHCFDTDCLRSGNIFHLVMQMENVDFKTAKTKLAEKAGVKNLIVLAYGDGKKEGLWAKKIGDVFIKVVKEGHYHLLKFYRDGKPIAAPIRLRPVFWGSDKQMGKIIEKLAALGAIETDKETGTKFQEELAMFFELCHSKEKIASVNNSLANINAAIKTFTDKLDMARQFIKIQPVFYDRNQCWWLWDIQTRCWRMIDDIDMLNSISKALENPGNTIEASTKNEILEALRRVGRENMPKDMPPTWIQFRNGIVDVLTGEEHVPSPEYFCTNPIPWSLGDSEETPTIDRIFTEWVGENTIIQLKEISAYCLLQDYPLHRVFALLGSGSNGKGRYLEFNIRFVGRENHISTQLERLVESRFEVAKLYRKLVCMMGETSGKALTNTDILKRASGGDLLPGEFKHKTPFNFTNYAKIIIASNTLPPTFDRTDGFYRRWHIIDFPNKFTEKLDVLAQIPENEYSNYARACVSILKKLIKDREFTADGTIEDRKKLYEERSCPTLQFFKLKYEKVRNSYVKLEDFYDDLVIWMDEQGYNTPTNKTVAKLLKDNGIEIERKTINQISARWLAGVKIKPMMQITGNDTEKSPLEGQKRAMSVMSQMSQPPYSPIRIGKYMGIQTFPTFATLEPPKTIQKTNEIHETMENTVIKTYNSNNNMDDGNNINLHEKIKKLPQEFPVEMWVQSGLTEQEFDYALKTGLIFEPTPGMVQKVK